MPILKWNIIELCCDENRCISVIRFEGEEQSFFQKIKKSGWVIRLGKAYCPEHSSEETK